ncbi:hypothetical protein [Alkalispirochaeta americana]|uniref:hypothetical protein n=1 Tax=Alkalispirochaeta americana TaxID=159291 RepID=UPI00135630C7|nr:hypothetical protein [Alkalispirochaeta americana]
MKRSPLYPESLSKKEPGWHHLQSLDGRWFRYPDKPITGKIDSGANTKTEISAKTK